MRARPRHRASEHVGIAAAFIAQYAAEEATDWMIETATYWSLLVIGVVQALWRWWDR